jgi:hypothetical protein
MLRVVFLFGLFTTSGTRKRDFPSVAVPIAMRFLDMP